MFHKKKTPKRLSESEERLLALCKKTTANTRKRRKDAFDKDSEQCKKNKDQKDCIDNERVTMNASIEQMKKVQNEELFQLVLERKRTKTPPSEELKE